MCSPLATWNMQHRFSHTNACQIFRLGYHSGLISNLTPNVLRTMQLKGRRLDLPFVALGLRHALPQSQQSIPSSFPDAPLGEHSIIGRRRGRKRGVVAPKIQPSSGPS